MRPTIESARFPAKPGVYAVYQGVDDERPLFVGAAAEQTLHQCWRGLNLAPRSSGSVLRRSLALHLGLVDELPNGNGHDFEPDVEHELTSFLRTCRVEFRTTETPEEARAAAVLEVLGRDPVLNGLGENGVDEPPAALPSEETPELEQKRRMSER